MVYSGKWKSFDIGNWFMLELQHSFSSRYVDVVDSFTLISKSIWFLYSMVMIMYQFPNSLGGKKKSIQKFDFIHQIPRDNLFFISKFGRKFSPQFLWACRKKSPKLLVFPYT